MHTGPDCLTPIALTAPGTHLFGEGCKRGELERRLAIGDAEAVPGSDVFSEKLDTETSVRIRAVDCALKWPWRGTRFFVG
jgi:hypothetical protein